VTTPIELRHAGYHARITPVGGALLSLRHDGRDLVLRTDAPVPTPRYAGAVLTPWPNRIADGSYEFAGEQHQLPVNEIDLFTALHGLALWDAWHVVVATPSSVTLSHALYPRPGYPFRVDTTVDYALDDNGLAVRISATNRGDVDAPVGLSIHPYFTVGDTSLVNEWTLTLPCASVLDTDERLLPTATVDAASLGLDFREPTVLGSTSLDHAFTSMTFDAGTSGATLVGGDGRGVRVSWDEACRWVQVYTLHTPDDAGLHRRAVAVEPMTCAPNAFNSGDGLTVLAPGESLDMSCAVAAIDG